LRGEMRKILRLKLGLMIACRFNIYR